MKIITWLKRTLKVEALQAKYHIKKQKKIVWLLEGFDTNARHV